MKGKKQHRIERLEAELRIAQAIAEKRGMRIRELEAEVAIAPQRARAACEKALLMDVIRMLAGKEPA